jgi:hypothetical protein
MIAPLDAQREGDASQEIHAGGLPMSKLSILSAVIGAALFVGAGIVLHATAPTVVTACGDRPCPSK